MQSFLFFLPSRRLLWRSKSVQGERKANISAYGPSGWRSSPEEGELRVAVRGMNFRSFTRCLAFVSYPLRFARPPTLGGQPHPVCSHAAFSYQQTYSVSLSLRAIRTALLP